MHKGKFIFSQLCDYLPKRVYDCLVDKYEGNKYVKTFTCWNHLLVMLFGQLSNRESLRDLVTTLKPHQRFFHHLGFGKSVSRSILSKANEVRDVNIFKLFAERMIALARTKRAGYKKDFFLDKKLYAFDSTTISLCLSVFWWTKLHHGKGGVKMHTLYDVKTDVPAFVIITDANVHDSKVMSEIPYEADSFYVFDRAYMSTKELYAIDKSKAYFIVREKHKMATIYSLMAASPFTFCFFESKLAAFTFLSKVMYFLLPLMIMDNSSGLRPSFLALEALQT